MHSPILQVWHACEYDIEELHGCTLCFLGYHTHFYSAHQSRMVLQALQLRRARQRGLQVGGLGFGVAPTRADQMAALLRTHEPRPGSAFC